jgi:hypothetical protein
MKWDVARVYALGVDGHVSSCSGDLSEKFKNCVACFCVALCVCNSSFRRSVEGFVIVFLFSVIFSKFLV